VKNADLHARKNAATPRGVGVMCDFYAARAENAGCGTSRPPLHRFAAGIAVLNTGHRHPKIVKAIAASELLHAHRLPDRPVRVVRRAG
jgi:4-aminobutyrate aminotransferase